MKNKIILLGDTHFGAHKNSKFFYKKQLEFFNNVFFHYIEENEIDTIIQLGDLFDNRRIVDIQLLHNLKNDIFRRLNNYNFYTLIGNHDIFLRNSNKISSSDNLLSEYNNFHVVSEFKTFNIKGLDIDFVPWINQENKDLIFKNIKESNSDICVGHFELNGFPMYPGNIEKNGYDSKFLNVYEQVFSGHFHTQSKKSNIHYIGTPYELTFGDLNDTKGFCVFDVDDFSVEFIKNPDFTYCKVVYPTEEKINVYDKIVKLVVAERDDYLDDFIDDLIKQKPEKLNILENYSETIADEEEIELKPTIDILIDNIKEGSYNNKNDLIKTIKEIYIEAT